MKHTATQGAKFKRLVRALRPKVSDSPVRAEGIAISILESLWHVAINSAPRGDIGKFENDIIAEMVYWEGDPDWLVKTLVEIGWLDESDEFRLVVHDWHDHAPNHVKGNVEKMGGWASEVPPKGATKGPDLKVPPQGTGAPNLTKPDLTLPNQTEPLTDASASVCGELPAEASPPAEPSPTVMEFPTTGKPPGPWRLTQAKLDEYRESYPGVDVHGECLKARQWLRDNPTKRKTPGGMPAYLTRWLNHCVNRATNQPRAGPGPSRGSDIKLSEIDLE